MGRDHNKKCTFFNFNAEDDKSKCNVCGLKLADSHAANLKRHLIAKHAKVFNEFRIENDKVQQNMKKRKILYETREASIVSSIIKIVTTDGKPFYFWIAKGFDRY